jgi:hypothetical protein
MNALKLALAACVAAVSLSACIGDGDGTFEEAGEDIDEAIDDLDDDD